MNLRRVRNRIDPPGSFVPQQRFQIVPAVRRQVSRQLKQSTWAPEDVKNLIEDKIREIMSLNTSR